MRWSDVKVNDVIKFNFMGDYCISYVNYMNSENNFLMFDIITESNHGNIEWHLNIATLSGNDFTNLQYMFNDTYNNSIKRIKIEFPELFI